MTGSLERAAWLDGLPAAISDLSRRWSLTLGPPYENASCSRVVPATRVDGTPAVLKLGMPHMEGRDEASGLRFWDGDPTVRLLEFDAGLNAMLLERCEPGTSLRDNTEEEQDRVLARLFHRLWRRPTSNHAFRPLSEMIRNWTEETMASKSDWSDAGLVTAGLRVFEALLETSTNETLLATDLHAGNVLRTRREPWLVIDPKPFVGDRAYDATQHLFNCPARMKAAPHETIHRFADLAELDADRVTQWMFARSAAEPRDAWTEASHAIARALAS
ncbi:MAG: aminoglycoside phosphotransferase family protein [Gemmatimonadaceae bacterium]